MGSVVLKDVEPNTVVAGNPAKFLRVNTDKKVFK
jgi:acetyltransferase-like isoleucine patch superfamily enzyme